MVWYVYVHSLALAKDRVAEQEYDSCAGFKAAVLRAWAEVATPATCNAIMGGVRHTWELCARNGGVQMDGGGRKVSARVSQLKD